MLYLNIENFLYAMCRHRCLGLEQVLDEVYLGVVGMFGAISTSGVLSVHLGPLVY